MSRKTLSVVDPPMESIALPKISRPREPDHEKIERFANLAEPKPSARPTVVPPAKASAKKSKTGLRTKVTIYMPEDLVMDLKLHAVRERKKFYETVSQFCEQGLQESAK